jgi:ribonuclease HI
MKPHAYLFVDGSSSRKDDVGAWAAVAATQTDRKMLYGVAYPTTISRCELTPIIEGLRWIGIHWARGSSGFRVTVYSDSEYTVKTLCGLYPRHKNEDLWKNLDEVAKGLQIRYIWRERNSLEYMEICDSVCSNLRKATIHSLTSALGDARNLERLLPAVELPEETGKCSDQSEDSLLTPTLATTSWKPEHDE